jgi:hypothetical protein
MTNYDSGTRLSLWTSTLKFVGIFTVHKPHVSYLEGYDLVLQGHNDRYTKEGLRQCMANGHQFRISSILTDTAEANLDPGLYAVKGIAVLDGKTILDVEFGPEPPLADEHLLYIMLKEVSNANQSQRSVP